MSLRSRCLEIQSQIDYTPATISDYSPSSSNAMRNLLEAGTFSYDTYSDKVFMSSIAWLAIAVVIGAIYIACVINGIWLRNWPEKATGCWECCKRPPSERYKKIYLKIALLCVSIMVAVSVLGVIVGLNNRSEGDKAACSLLNIADEINNGSSSINWRGVRQSEFSYYWLNKMFLEESGEVARVTINTDATHLTNRVQTYQDFLDELFAAKGNYYVSSANPLDTSTTLIETEFLRGLGPKTTTGTFLNSLYEESNKLRESITTSATELETIVSNYATLLPSMQTEIANAKDKYAEFGPVLGDFATHVADYLEGSYNEWVVVNQAVTVSYYLYIGLGVILYLTIMGHHQNENQTTSQISYIAWHCLMLWAIAAAILSSQMQMLRKRTGEHCDTFNYMSTYSDFFKKLPQYNNSFGTTMGSCFFENGDTFRATGMETSGNVLGQIAYYIRNIENYTVDGPGSFEIPAQKAIMDLYIQGLILANNDSTNPTSTIYNLNALNSWSNYSYDNGESNQFIRSDCKITTDEWVMNTTNCTNAAWNDLDSATAFFGEKICMGIWSFDPATITNRYQDAKFPGCSVVGTDTISQILEDQYDALDRHFSDTKNKFQQLKRYYDMNLNTQYKLILRNATEMTDPIRQLNQSLEMTLDYIAGPEHGILNNSNCSFIRSNLLASNVYICKASSAAQKTMITLIVSTFLAAACGAFTYLYFRKLEIDLPTRQFMKINSKEKETATALNQIMPEEDTQRFDTSHPDFPDAEQQETVIHGERIEM